MAPAGLLSGKLKEEWPGRPCSSLSLARAPTRATEHQPSSAWSSRPNTAQRVSRQSNDGYNLDTRPVARPLRLENASADLIRDLERLSGLRPRCRLAEELVHKANDKLHEFLELHTCAADPERQTMTGTDHENESLKQLNAKFVELMSEVEEAMAGGTEPSLPPLILRPGTILEETLEAPSKVFVMIPLPSRRVEVVVLLTRVSGDVHLYGSDVDPRPSPSSELEEEGGELCYRHDPESSAGNGANGANGASGAGGNGSHGGNRGVRTALYLCIEADGENGQASSVRLRVNLRRLVDAQAASLQTACKRVEQKLAVIRNDAAYRHKFEERLKEVKEHFRQKSPSRRNFCKINLIRAKMYGADGARTQRSQRMQQQRMRMQHAELRREELDLRREERMQWWMERHELRRLEKEKELQEQQEALQMSPGCMIRSHNVAHV